jgi:hypothetical protein
MVLPSPAIKPFNERTGPEKVVKAMMIPHMRVEVYLSACRQPRGCQIHRKNPGWAQYNPYRQKEKGAEAPFS